MGSKAGADKPHAVFIPYPAQSHIKAMLKLAKLLHLKGFHITFVNTEFNHKRLLKARAHNSLDGFPDFKFETIPDSLPPSDPDATQDVPALSESINKNFLAPFRQLIAKLNDSVLSNVPPVTSIISDGFMSAFTITAAEELGIPIVLFYTIAACSFMGLKQYRSLKDKGLTPLKDESYLTNGYLDTVIDWIPGMQDISLRDLPSFLRSTDPNDIMFEFTMEAAERAHEASAVIIHTFDAMEQDILDALSSLSSRLYTIGPLQLFLNQIPNDPLRSVGYNLWKEETECLKWLHHFKEPNSVVYVNFGSLMVMTQQHLLEFAMGIASSKIPFLWIIRPDLVIGESATLPPEFMEATKERGFIASWCPQEEVLNHPSIGGFLTHSGWGSTIESISAGVPMLCWPFFADQQTNSRYSCIEWGIGMEIDNNVKRDEVEILVRELMEGEKGKTMKKKAMEWKKLAEEATGHNGSSSTNLEKLVNEVLLITP